MVAKLVNATSEDAATPAEIIFQINMLTADQIPVQEGGRRVLAPDAVRAAIMGYVENSGASGKIFENLRPPEFSGEKKDFELWHQRFNWHIRNTSAVFAKALTD